MALTAKFIADFSSFNDAVQKAEVKLTEFATGASKVEGALKRMSDSLVGRKVVQEAALMAKSVEAIGGVSKLTASNLERVASSARAAVDQLQRLGKDVPEGIARLAHESSVLLHSNEQLAKQAKDQAKSLSDLQAKLRGAGEATSTLGDKARTLNGLLGGLGVGLSIGAVVSFGKALLNDADALTKMSDRTGIGVVALQRLQVAGDDAGNSIEDMTGAINQMQNRLASGDKSAVAALQRLNISLEEFQRLSPDQQFIQISDAIRTIEDPAVQVSVAMDLFGRSALSVLPTIKRGFDDVRDSAVGMSEDTVRALDDAGDAMSRWWRQSKGITAEALVMFVRFADAGFGYGAFKAKEMAREASRTAEELHKLTNAIKSPALFTGATSTSFPLPDDAAMKAFNRDMDEQARINEKAAAAAKKAAEEYRVFAQNVRDVAESAKGFGVVVQTIDGNVLEGIRYYVERGVSLDKLAKMYELTGVQVEALTRQFKFEADTAALTERIHIGLGRELEKVGVVTVNLASTALPQLSVAFAAAASEAGNLATRGTTLADSLKAAFKNLPRVIGEALVGGGGFSGAMKAFGSQVGALFTESLGKSVSKNIGGKLGAVLGDIIGPLGSLLGPMLGKIGGWIGLLFGNNEEKKINPIRQAFVDAAGGLDVLNRKAAQAGVTLRAMLDAKNPKEYEQAIRELNAALEFQSNAMAKLDETVKKYGFSIEELGPALQRQALDTQAQQLYQDFKVLTGAGISVDVVLGKMGASINEFVKDALKTGTEIPAAMAPMLQRMVEMGQLVDANGNVITDLEAAGVSFAMTMSEGFQALIGEVQKLTDAIARGLGLAIERIPDPEVTGHVRWQIDPIPGSEAPDRYADAIPMAAGGMGTVTKPTLFLAGEAGPEQFAFSGAGKTLGGNGSVTVTIGPITVQAAEGDDPQRVSDVFLEALRTQAPLYKAIATIAERAA